VYGAQLAKYYGFDRVILARETKLEEIKKITQIIETEVFVQGALCTCFSGQCYLSSFVGGNSGNRGKCKQPCRKMYSIDRSGCEEKSYAISLSDLSVGENIKTLVKAGVYSFKIEGRMRRPEYVAAAVTYYKNILEDNAKPTDKSALKRTYNRGNYTTGLMFGQDKSFISSAVQGHIGEYCGTVKVVSGKFICQSNIKCSQGDGFKLLRDGKEICGATFGGEVKGGFILNTNYRLKNGDKAFITTDVDLNSALLSVQRKLDVKISAQFILNERAKITINGQEYTSSFVLEEASNRPLSAEDIKKCFDKIDTYPFSVNYVDIAIVGDIFVPASALNAFRRQVYADYFTTISQNKNKQIKEVQPLPNIKLSGRNNKIAAITTNLQGLKADIGILKLNDYTIPCEKVEELIKDFSGEKFLFLPTYFSSEDVVAISDIITLFDGIYCDGYYSIELCKSLNKKLFAGTGFNLSNTIALSQLSCDYIALSKELTTKEAKPLVGENTFYLTVGDLKVMDLIYCPFGKTCKNCDKRGTYSLTDENGRVFPLRRYKTSECRFEMYNCASLIARNDFCGKLVDCTLQTNANNIIENIDDGEKLKKIFKNYTKGHSEIPVL
jgi:putative protease